MEKNAADAVVQCPDGVLSFAVLRGCVWIGKAKYSAVSSEMIAHGIVVELATIISLYGEQWQLELRVYISVKGNNAGVNFGFCTQWKGPHVMGIIIY